MIYFVFLCFHWIPRAARRVANPLTRGSLRERSSLHKHQNPFPPFPRQIRHTPRIKMLRTQWEGAYLNDSVRFAQFLPSSQSPQQSSALQLQEAKDTLQQLLSMRFPRFLRCAKCTHLVGCDCGLQWF